MFSKRMSSRTFLILFCVMMVIVFSTYSIVNDQALHHSKWYERSAPCVTPKHVINEMANLTFIVSEILNSYGVPHVLCYGTLWGALRIGRILPWENNVNICVMREGLDKAPWSSLMDSMSSHKLDTSYDNLHGELTIRRNSAVCVMTVFSLNSSKKVVRDGWEYKHLSFMVERTEEIPPHLMKGPFPTITFHGRPGLPVPHDDVELLKYLFKDDWWFEKPPLGCKGMS